MMCCPELIEYKNIMSNKSEEEKKVADFVSSFILALAINRFRKHGSIKILMFNLKHISDYNRPFMDQVIARPIEKLPYFLTRQYGL